VKIDHKLFSPQTYLVNEGVLVARLYGASSVSPEPGHTARNIHNSRGLKFSNAEVAGDNRPCAPCAGAAVNNTGTPAHVGPGLQQECDQRARIFWDTLYGPAHVPQVHHFTPWVRLQVLQGHKVEYSTTLNN
jgi:hypothetical protein